MGDKVIIITLNYNQSDYTAKCIKSLLDSEYDNYTILLIDNGSEPEQFKRIGSIFNGEQKIIIHRIEKNCGYVGGINFGLKKALIHDADYYLIMNNDTIIDKFAIRELVKTSTEWYNKVIVTGKVYFYDKPNVIQDIGHNLINKKLLRFSLVGYGETDNGQYDQVSERDMIDDVFWLIPKDLYSTIGGYSPYFWFNAEQTDFALRAKKAGYKLIFNPKALIWHKGSLSIGGRDYNPNLAFWTIQSSLILRYLHLNKIQFFYFYTYTLASIIQTSLKALYLKVFRKVDITDYASAKVSGLIYFNKWIFRKMPNTGEKPF